MKASPGGEIEVFRDSPGRGEFDLPAGSPASTHLRDCSLHTDPLQCKKYLSGFAGALFDSPQTVDSLMT